MQRTETHMQIFTLGSYYTSTSKSNER